MSLHRSASYTNRAPGSGLPCKWIPLHGSRIDGIPFRTKPKLSFGRRVTNYRRSCSVGHDGGREEEAVPFVSFESGADAQHLAQIEAFRRAQGDDKQPPLSAGVAAVTAIAPSPMPILSALPSSTMAKSKQRSYESAPEQLELGRFCNGRHSLGPDNTLQRDQGTKRRAHKVAPHR